MGDTVWLYSGHAALALAIVIIAWALFFDLLRHRFRPPRRCPKCWYDLSRTEGLTCSECGYTARKERKLHKSRRRWRWAFVALIPLIAADQLPRVPAVKERGWVATVPTPVLALSLLWIEPDSGRRPNPFMRRRGAPVSTTPRATAIMIELLNHRLNDEEDLSFAARYALRFAAWWNDATLYGDRSRWPTFHDMINATTKWANTNAQEFGDYEFTLVHPNELSLAFISRREWPVGADVYANVHANTNVIMNGRDSFTINASSTSRGASDWSFDHSIDVNSLIGISSFGIWDDGQVRIGRAESGIDRLHFDVSARTLMPVHFTHARRWCDRPVSPTQFDLPIDPKNAPILTAVRDESFDALLQTSFRPIIFGTRRHRLGPGMTILLNLGFMRDRFMMHLHERNVTFAVKVEVLSGDTIIGRSQAWFSAIEEEQDEVASLRLDPSSLYLRVNWVDDALDHLQSGEPIHVRLRGDHDLALRDFDSTRYWDGELVSQAFIIESSLVPVKADALQDVLRRMR